MNYFTCAECGGTKPTTPGLTTGYGWHRDNATGAYSRKVCFACCGLCDARTMKSEGRIALYLTRGDTRVTNWPSTLAFTVMRCRKGRHNIARTRTDVWFYGPDGREWHGTQYGDMTQIVHCRRVQS